MVNSSVYDVQLGAPLSRPATHGVVRVSNDEAGDAPDEPPLSRSILSSLHLIKSRPGRRSSRSRAIIPVSWLLLSTILFLTTIGLLIPGAQCAATPVDKTTEFSFGTLSKRQATASSVESTCACHKEEKHNATFGVEAAMIPVLVLLSGAFAGLTLGYMSLDATQLSVLAKSGTERQRQLAQKILPIRKDGHLLLITLLISNMICNEVLPIVSDPVLGGGVQAVVVSTVLIVIFAEIIPQSVCSRFGLQVGAYAVWPVRCLVFVFYPITWPIARLLTKLLGAHAGVIYRRAELKELVEFHGETNEHGGDLNRDVVTIVGATLDLQEKRVRDAMTPISKCFMLNIDDRLTFETLGKVLQSGHSRVPVYEEVLSSAGGSEPPRRKILGVLLTKNLILIDPEDGVPLREYPLHPLPIVSDIMPLLNILNSFQEGRSHMAIVCPRKAGFYDDRDMSGDHPDSPKSDTAEADAPSGDESGSNSDHKGRLGKLFRRTRTNSVSSRKSGKSAKSAKSHTSDKAEKGELDLGSKALLVPLEEDMPMGIITLEDVIEELLGEEIYDETDLTPLGNTAVRPYVPPEAEAAIRSVRQSAARSSNNRPAALKTKQPQTTQTQPSGMTGITSPPPPPGMLKSAAAKLSFVGGMSRSRSAPGKSRSGASPAGTSTSGTPVGGRSGGLLSPISPLSEKENDLVPMPMNLSTVTTSESNAKTALDHDTIAASDGPSQDDSVADDVNGNTSRTVVGAPSRSGTPLSPPPQASNGGPAGRAVPPRLSHAILLERGRRALVRQGGDPNDMTLMRLTQPSTPGATATPGVQTASARGGGFPLGNAVVVGAGNGSNGGNSGPRTASATPNSSATGVNPVLSPPPVKGAFKLPARAMSVPLRTGGTPAPPENSANSSLTGTSTVKEPDVMSPMKDENALSPGSDADEPQQ